MTQQKAQSPTGRDARLQAALRENLKRRKAQARSRQSPPPSDNEKEAQRHEARTDPAKHRE